MSKQEETTMPKLIQTLILSEDEQNALKKLVNQGKHAARQIKRAQILLHSHAGKTPQEVANLLGVSRSAVYKIRQRYLSEGLKSALVEKARPGQPAKLDLRQQAAITLLACSKAPAGHARWSIRLLADRVVKAEIVDHIAPETLRLFLKKTNLSLG
jgi:putative transposase